MEPSNYMQDILFRREKKTMKEITGHEFSIIIGRDVLMKIGRKCIPITPASYDLITQEIFSLEKK